VLDSYLMIALDFSEISDQLSRTYLTTATVRALAVGRGRLYGRAID
jgi:hypothetical protein